MFGCAVIRNKVSLYRQDLRIPYPLCSATETVYGYGLFFCWGRLKFLDRSESHLTYFLVPNVATADAAERRSSAWSGYLGPTASRVLSIVVKSSSRSSSHPFVRLAISTHSFFSPGTGLEIEQQTCSYPSPQFSNPMNTSASFGDHRDRTLQNSNRTTRCESASHVSSTSHPCDAK